VVNTGLELAGERFSIGTVSIEHTHRAEIAYTISRIVMTTMTHGATMVAVET